MKSFRKITVSALCLVAVAMTAAPASAEGSHGGGHGGHGGGGYSHGGWGGHHGWGDGGRHGGRWRNGDYFAAGALGLGAAALFANGSSYYGDGPYGDCSATVSYHRDAYGRLVKVIHENPC
jgi:hypothetical protein